MQARHQHTSAAELFAELLHQLPDLAVEITGEGRQTMVAHRDELWLRRLYLLCLRNLGSCRQALGEATSATACFKEALRLSRAADGGEVSGEEGSLWHAAAQSASESRDWPAARLAHERCLRLWPRGNAALRGLSQALLMLGDLRARRALGGGLAQEAWLQRPAGGGDADLDGDGADRLACQRVCRAHSRARPGQAGAGQGMRRPAREPDQDYASLSRARAKRFKAEAAAENLGAEARSAKDQLGALAGLAYWAFQLLQRLVATWSRCRPAQGRVSPK